MPRIDLCAFEVAPKLPTACVFAAVAVLPSCGGGGGNSASPTPTQANITLTVLPNPATAAACNPACIAPNSGLAFPFRFSATLTIQETGGVGGNVDFVNVTGQHGGRTFGTINFGSDLIVQRVGTNHVSARGTLSFAFSIDFDNQDGSTHDRLETANIQLTDDRGNRITSTIQFNVI